MSGTDRSFICRRCDRRYDGRPPCDICGWQPRETEPAKLISDGGQVEDSTDRSYRPKPGDEVEYKSRGGWTEAEVVELGWNGSPVVETSTGLTYQPNRFRLLSEPQFWVYLASDFSLKDRVRHVHDVLSDEGIDVPDVWWDESKEQADLKQIDLPDEEWYQNEKVVQRAERHWQNIGRADAFAIVCPSDGTKKYNGANIELGYAIAEDVPCFSVGKLERSAMYEPVEQLNSAEELARNVLSLYTEIDREADDV